MDSLSGIASLLYVGRNPPIRVMLRAQQGDAQRHTLCAWQLLCHLVGKPSADLRSRGSPLVQTI